MRTLPWRAPELGLPTGVASDAAVRLVMSPTGEHRCSGACSAAVLPVADGMTLDIGRVKRWPTVAASAHCDGRRRSA